MTVTNQVETVGDRIEQIVGVKGSFTELRNGAIAIEKGRYSYWIDDELLDVDVDELEIERPRTQGLRDYARELEGVSKFDGERRAPEFMTALDEQLGYNDVVRYRPDVAGVTLPRDADVPVSIAAEGKYFVAAWLAAHGHSNGTIASALDVAESTIKVELSKFKNDS